MTDAIKFYAVLSVIIFAMAYVHTSDRHDPLLSFEVYRTAEK